MKTPGCVLLGLLLLVCADAHAQTSAPYPSKAVRILVGFAPGGGIDISARMIAQRLTDALGHPFIVENRPGGGGTMASDIVAKAPPDGHTLVMVSVTHAINASLYKKLPYDSIKSFTPVTPVSAQAGVIAVHPSLPVETLGQLIALAKAKPGDIAYAHAGKGTLQHVGMEFFLSLAGIKMLAVPYNGSGPATIAALGGQVPVLSVSLPPALPHARAGKLKILAVTSARRTPLASDFPSVNEAAGLEGYEAVVWIGLLAPAGTPGPVVNRLNQEVERLLQTAEMREQMTKQATDPYHETPAAFAELIRNDIVKWGRIVREAGLTEE
jgi:tripartite-type tricarboxylate transporter receptor subunit TctC